MRILNFFLLVFMIIGCGSPSYKDPRLEIKTQLGNIVIEIYPDKAPKSCSAILSYVDSGFYKNASFYRVLNTFNQPSYSPKSELIQGGIWQSNPKRAVQIPGIQHETTRNSGLHHKDGTVSLARNEPGSAGTEFFICIGDQPGFDFGGENNPDGQGYAAFGKVISGMDVVHKIYNRRERDQQFDPPIAIYEIIKRF